MRCRREQGLFYPAFGFELVQHFLSQTLWELCPLLHPESLSLTGEIRFVSSGLPDDLFEMASGTLNELCWCNRVGWVLGLRCRCEYRRPLTCYRRNVMIRTFRQFFLCGGYRQTRPWPNRWSLVSHMVSVRPSTPETKKAGQRYIAPKTKQKVATTLWSGPGGSLDSLDLFPFST